MDFRVNCANCGIEIPIASVQTVDDIPCPKCNSVSKTVVGSHTDNLFENMHSKVRIKSKDNSLPSDQKVRVEIQAGEDYRRSNSTWVYKHRLIDKDNDRYKESVVEKSTGEIIHQCEEKLSEHRSHGSAKVKPELPD